MAVRAAGAGRRIAVANCDETEVAILKCPPGSEFDTAAQGSRSAPSKNSYRIPFSASAANSGANGRERRLQLPSTMIRSAVAAPRVDEQATNQSRATGPDIACLPAGAAEIRSPLPRAGRRHHRPRLPSSGRPPPWRRSPVI